MDKGYVYLARLVDYNGNFVGNFYKVGKSQQYKVRETQLNSTHLPIDVVFVRVFETEKMNSLEKILHACLVDYRVEKKYSDRRNITTEWFDMEDDDDFNYRVDEVIKHYPFTNELNLLSKIQSDSGSTSDEKTMMINAVKKQKSTLRAFENDIEYTQTTAQDTFCLTMVKIAKIVGISEFMKQTVLLRDSMESIKEVFPKSFRESYVRVIDGCYVWANMSNQQKLKYLQEHLDNNKIRNIRLSLEN